MKFFGSLAVTTAAVLTLSACGGGGSSPTPRGGNNGGGGTISSQGFTKAQTRSEAQTALTAYSQAAGASATSVLSTVRHIMDVRAGRHPLATPTCSVGAVNSFTSVTVTNLDGSTTETDTTYYDLACKTPETIDVTNLPNVPPTATSVTVTGTVTNFDRSGNVTGFASISATVSETATTESVSLTERIGPNATAAPVDQIGVTCSAPVAAPQNVTCGAASVLASSTGSSGSSLAIADTQQATSNNLIFTNTETFTASLYSGTTLSIAQGSGTAWSVTGASPFSTVSGSISVTLNGSFPTAGTISETDSTSGVTVSGTVTSTAVNITVTQGATSLATIALDANGNGTITYADGSTETIIDYTVKSS